MSCFTFNNSEIILHDAANLPRSLVGFGNIAANQSDMTQINLVNEVNGNLHKLFDKTAGDAINLIIYLRLVTELMRKPQKHDVLHIGQWSPLDDTLVVTLPKFNAKNFLWHYAPVRPVGKFSSVNFIFAEVNGGGYIIPENKFGSVIFSEQTLPPIEVLLATKDHGKVFFVAPKSALPDFWTDAAQTFDLEKNFSVVELELSPTFKSELRRRSPQGQTDDKKAQIKQTVLKVHEVAKKFNALPPQEKNAFLDEYITEITRAEKILNEIFPEVHSDTIKLNFNMFKEFLIDFRLYENWQLKSRAAEDLNHQIGVLEQDLNTL